MKAKCKKCNEEFEPNEKTTEEYCEKCHSAIKDSYNDLIDALPQPNVINENTHDIDLKSGFLED